MEQDATLPLELQNSIVEWVQRHHVPLASGDLRADLNQLAELGGLEHEAEAFVTVLQAQRLPPLQVDRLLRLHAAVRCYLQEEEAAREEANGPAPGHDWVGAKKAAATAGTEASDDFLWIDQEDRDEAPSGPAPALVSRPVKPRRRSGRKKRKLRGSDLIVPGMALLLVAASVLLVVRDRLTLRSRITEAQRVQALAEQDVDAQARGQRLSRQVAIAEFLGELRGRQRELVNGSCEGGAWCLEQLQRIDASARLAERLLEDAQAWQPAPPAEESWRPSAGFLSTELQVLELQLTSPTEQQAEDFSAAVRRAEVHLLRSAIGGDGP